MTAATQPITSVDPPHLTRARRSWVQRLLLCMNIFLILAALGVAGTLNYGYSRASALNRIALDRNLTPVPAGAQPGNRVLNVLLVGSDSSAGLDPNDPIQIGRKGERFGDVIIIAHLDEASGQIALLSLPRDLWVTIAGSDRERRINAAYDVGGAAALVDTIEENLEIPINHYVNVDFAGFQGLVSAVGSVDVVFDTPARDWDVTATPEPRSRTGFIVESPGCHSLGPEQALAYVRSRYYQTQNGAGEWVTDPTSDLGRIRRQQDFLRRLMQTAIDLGVRNPFVLKDLVDTGMENVVVDQELTAQLLVDLGTTYRSFDPDQLLTYSLPVADGLKGTDQVLLAREEDAEPILRIFRGSSIEDHSTVRLTVLTAAGDDPADGLAAQVAAVASAAGFEVESGHVADSKPGVVLQHGPDGQQAAELVRKALEQGSLGETDVRVAQVAHLPGRSIHLRVGDLDRPEQAAQDESAQRSNTARVTNDAIEPTQENRPQSTASTAESSTVGGARETATANASLLSTCD